MKMGTLWNRKRGIDALILAGGKSSRMGGNHKGNLKIGGETFTQHLIQEISGEVDQVWISYGKDVHEIYKSCKIVKDRYLNCGPMSGIHAGLTETESNWLFVVACDMPFMQAEFLEELKPYMIEDTQIIVPIADGRMHPLAALYHRSVLPFVIEQLEKEDYKLRNLYKRANVTYVNITSEKSQRMLQNINTPEDYQNIR